MTEREYFEWMVEWHIRIPKPKKVLKALKTYSPIIVFSIWMCWGAWIAWCSNPVTATPWQWLSSYFVDAFWTSVGFAFGIVTWFATRKIK